jgi:Asp/Glu/hydantoin racemase
LAGTAEVKPLGILMLDTRFPRIEGDIGNAASFDFPVIFQRLEGIGPSDAVAAHPDRPRVMKALAANAQTLAQAGAVGISTSCGFLALYQQELASVSPVPVATSALMLIPMLVGKKVGVITASARNLTPAHLIAVRAPADTPIEGMPEAGAFAATFLANGTTLDREAVEAEAIAAGRSLLAKHPQVDEIVLECTNLPPYSAALKRALGVPVHDVLDLLRDFRKRLG